MTGTAYQVWSTKMSSLVTYYRLDPPYRYETWEMEPFETRYLALLQDESAPSSHITILAPALPGPVPKQEPFVPLWDVHWRDGGLGSTSEVLLKLGYELLEDE